MTAAFHTEHLKHESTPTRGAGGMGSTLSLMLLTIGVFWLASLIFSAEGLPDYESYEQIYEIDALNFSLASSEPLFVAIIQAGKFFGLDYEQFRSATLLVSIGLLSISLYRVEKWLK